MHEGKGALTLDAQAEDGQFTVENISYYKDAKLATDLSADADWARRGLYIGPQFETLDENVQAQFEAFLNERGIDSDLARFVPDFAELKEQKEYCSWLENVKAFVDA
ncbi:regulatory protein suaprga1 [Ceraceosorus bombacis]|uniref:Regulatory protein suaprga1 n=1 Tax=Ceraceosorus bombacis TaxID=401625 RepID=A0A0P1BLT3_9BASI|nr:regulatory protein suaprga1 [Ceraceosorus bombacis]